MTGKKEKIMRLDHSQKVLNIDGKPFKWSEDRDLTFKALAIHALGTENPDEKLGAEKKARCWQTTQKFLKGKKVTLTVEEAALIKERGGATLANIVYGRLCDWIEEKEQIVESEDADDSDDEDAKDDEGSKEDKKDAVIE